MIDESYWSKKSQEMLEAIPPDYREEAFTSIGMVIAATELLPPEISISIMMNTCFALVEETVRQEKCIPLN